MSRLTTEILGSIEVVNQGLPVYRKSCPPFQYVYFFIMNIVIFLWKTPSKPFIGTGKLKTGKSFFKKTGAGPAYDLLKWTFKDFGALFCGGEIKIPLQGDRFAARFEGEQRRGGLENRDCLCPLSTPPSCMLFPSGLNKTLFLTQVCTGSTKHLHINQDAQVSQPCSRYSHRTLHAAIFFKKKNYWHGKFPGWNSSVAWIMQHTTSCLLGLSHTQAQRPTAKSPGRISLNTTWTHNGVPAKVSLHLRCWCQFQKRVWKSTAENRPLQSMGFINSRTHVLRNGREKR